MSATDSCSCASGPAPAGAPPGDAGAPRYWGKYRGTVIDNIDLTQQARLLCDVPALPGMLLNWALPCVPYAGLEQGFFALPPIGANVWVEFEGGDPNYPVWTGCFWEIGEVPVAPELSPEDPSLVKVFRSDLCTLIFNDTPEVGGITLQVMDPAVDLPVTLTMTSLGVQVNVGELELSMNPEVGISLVAAEATVNVTPEAIVGEAPEISLTAEADVNITGTTTVEGDTSIVGAVDIEGATSIGPAVEIEGTLDVTGAVEMAPEVNITGSLDVEGDVTATGASTFVGDANVVGPLVVASDFTLMGVGDVVGDFAVAGLIEGVVVPPLL